MATRVYDGKDLAKVLIYYGQIDDVTATQFKICCPFHDDLTPSMVVDLSKGTFLCYGCGLSGNAYDFVRFANTALSALQCCVLLEQILRSDEIKKLQINIQKKKRKTNRQALAEAHDEYYGLRTTDWNYPKTEEETLVLDYMQKRGFTPRALNIAQCKADYSKVYPIIFPILDNGTFKGWVKRSVSKYADASRKYLYNTGFSKRDTLCGNYSENSIVFLCEGYLDYLSLRTRGHVKNVCALLGWHLSDLQAQKLKDKGIIAVVSALDNDKSGIKGTKLLEKYFTVIRFAFPDGVKDTGEMTEQQLKTAIIKTKKAARQNGIRM